MSDTSTNLVLPYLAAGQAQKHVTVNESLRKLDAIVQLSVVSASTSAQPGSPSDGQVYILPAGKTGAAWGAMANHALAYYRDGAWEQISPREGWLAFVKDSDELLFYTGAAWALFAAAKLLTLSATDRLIGRDTAGAGAAEELTVGNGLAFTGAGGIGIANDGVTYARMQNVSATDKLLGRATSGAGDVEEIACTAAGRALIDDADAAAQRTTLGLGTAAVKNTGTSGNTVSLLDGANSWSALQTHTADIHISHAQPGLQLHETDVGADLKRFWLFNTGGATHFMFANDASNAFHTFLRIQRSTYTATGVRPDAPLFPWADNTYDLGSASFRWKEVFAGAGTINTSDAREKTALAPIPAGVKRAVKRVIAGVGVFQWLSSVEAKGEERARLHVGLTAQAVREAFLAEGEDPERWALFCEDAVFEEVEIAPARVIETALEHGRIERRVVPPRTETRPVLDADGTPRTRLGVRYEQLFALGLAAVMETINPAC